MTTARALTGRALTVPGLLGSCARGAGGGAVAAASALLLLLKSPSPMLKVMPLVVMGLLGWGVASRERAVVLLSDFRRKINSSSALLH